jgi:TldD protein
MDTKIKSDLISTFKKVVELGKSNNFYIDCNFLSKRETSIRKDQMNSDISKDNNSGVKLRLWDGDKFLESASSKTEEKILLSLAQELIDLGKKSNIQDKKELKVESKKVEKEVIFEEEKLDLKKLVPVLEDYNSKIKDLDKSVINARAIIVSKFEEHLFVNQYTQVFQSIPISLLAMVGFIQTPEGESKMVYNSYVSRNFHENEIKFKKDLPHMKQKIEAMLKAKKLKGGKYKVLLHPHLTGLLAHESFGHGMEADTMLKNRALASKYVGKKIGKEFINIVDYPAIAGKHGEFYFDHDGQEAKKTYLVKNGIINEPMADIYSKTNLDLKHSSNSRMEAFDHKNYTRMSNTYFEPGTKPWEELLEGIEDGILITDSSGGMEDPKGWGVQIQGNFGQRIKDGKLVDEYFDGFTLTGFLPDIVSNIVDISKEFEMEGGGHCGKGHKEWVRVAEGGPYMLINEVTLG